MAGFTLQPPPQNAGNEELTLYLKKQYEFLRWVLLNLDDENMAEQYGLYLKELHTLVQQKNKEIEKINDIIDEINTGIYDGNIPPWDGNVANGFKGGIGTEDDPFIISNVPELVYFRNSVNNGYSYAGKYIKLTNNLDWGAKWEYRDGSMLPVLTSGENWVPIGTCKNIRTDFGVPYNGNAAPFEGIFDGGGHIILNLFSGIDENTPVRVSDSYYDRTWGATQRYYTTVYVGLFGFCKDCTIKNIAVDGYIGFTGATKQYLQCIDDVMANIKSGVSVSSFGCQHKIYIGSIVAGSSYSRYSGNLVSAGNTLILNAFNRAQISADNSITKASSFQYLTTDEITVGGLMGVNEACTFQIRGCYNVGKIDLKLDEDSYNFRAGGLVGNTANLSGYNYTPVIRNCYSISEITCDAGNLTSVYVGGICGSGAGVQFANLFYCKDTLHLSCNQTDTTDKSCARTAAEMRGSTLISQLNNGDEYFIEDTKNQNNGFPILKWQEGQ